jgi:hypothetical protein
VSFALMSEFGFALQRAFMGNAILSCRPLSEVIGARSNLLTKVNFNGRAITLGVMHLNSRWDPAGRHSRWEISWLSFRAKARH